VSGDTPVKVLIPGALRSCTLAPHVEAVGDTLDELFADLDRRYPGLRFRVVDEQNRLRPNMRVFVNDSGVRELAHALPPDDCRTVSCLRSGIDCVLALSSRSRDAYNTTRGSGGGR
jgi:molybdopterin synthase sulfur carrier subunit